MVYVTLLPSWTSVTLEYFLAESKSIEVSDIFFTHSIVSLCINEKSHQRSVRTIAANNLSITRYRTVVNANTSDNICGKCRVIFASESNTRTFPVAISTTERRPSVIVPVLSLKRILKLPAVSRPLIFSDKNIVFCHLQALE